MILGVGDVSRRVGSTKGRMEVCRVRKQGDREIEKVLLIDGETSPRVEPSSIIPCGDACLKSHFH